MIDSRGADHFDDQLGQPSAGRLDPTPRPALNDLLESLLGPFARHIALISYGDVAWWGEFLMAVFKVQGSGSNVCRSRGLSVI